LRDASQQEISNAWQPDLQMTMLTTVSTEAMVPADHPLRRIRTIVDAVLAEMDGDFEAMYSSIGRPSVPRRRC